MQSYDSVENTKVSTQEAEKVVALWAERQRLREAQAGQATVADLAEGLRLTPAEAYALLNEVRAGGKPRRHFDRSVWISLGAALVIVAVLIPFFFSFRVSREVPERAVMAGAPTIAMPEMPPMPDMSGIPARVGPDSRASSLNSEAWDILDDSSATNADLRVAEAMATRANEIAKGQDANILDTLAKAKARLGKYDEAVKFQEQAVKQFESSGGMGGEREFRQRLEQYREEATAQTAKR